MVKTDGKESTVMLASLKHVREYFDTDARPMRLPDFREEWAQGGLTEEDKIQLRTGLADGTMTY